MESQAVTKLGIGFAILMAVGFLIVGTTRESQQEKMQGAFLQSSNMLGTLSLGKCSEEVKSQIGTHPYTPSETDSDHLKYATLIWNNVGSAKRVECRYVLDQGITLLKVDDKVVIQQEITTTTSGGGGTSGGHHQ